MSIKINKVCCFSLSRGCCFLGLLELASYIYLITYFSSLEFNPDNSIDVLRYVTSITGLCTCLLMICGTMMKNRWFLLPHIILTLLCIMLSGVTGLVICISALVYGNILFALILAAAMFCVLPLYIYYWIIMYNLYHEIKREQSAPPDLIEMA